MSEIKSIPFNSFCGPAITRSEMPVTFRLAKYPHGETFIQAGYLVNEGFKNWIEWQKMDFVDVDENGRAEGDYLEKGDA